MKKTIKRLLKVLLYVVVIMMVIPYFIPTNFDNEIPCLPFENSVFYKTSDDVILHTQVYKPESEIKGKVLMIHGLGASTYSFSHNAPILQDNGYFVVSVDLPAFGYSSKDKGINHSQIENAKRLWDLLDDWDRQLDSTTPWTIVGHSMGGSTSLAMTNQVPSHIQSLILISPAITQKPNAFSWLFKSPLGEWLKVILRYNIIRPKNIENLLEKAYGFTPTEEDITGYLAPLQTTTTPQALVDFVVSSKNVSIDQLVPKNITIHLLWGEKDTFVPPSQIKVIEKAYPIASVTMLKDGGHCAHEKDSTVNQVLLDILSSTP